MVIKVQNPGTQPTPASTQQIIQLQTDLGINPDAVNNSEATTIAQSVVSANTSLGALAAPVQSLISAAIAALKLNGISGPLSASNSTVSTNGTSTDLQTAWNSLQTQLNAATGSSTIPAVTTAPASPAGTTTVGSTLAAGNGSWTNTPAQYKYQWYDINQTTGVPSILLNATSSTYVLKASDAGFKVTYTVQAAQTGAASVFSAPVYASSPSAVITATLPTYAGGTLPSITPTGSQAANVVLTCSTGTLSGGNTGATFAYQWQFKPSGGAYSNIQGATVSTFTTQSGQVGGQVQCLVSATTTQGTGTPGTSSNAITITGSVVLTPTVAPTFTNTLTAGTLNPIIPATFTGGVLDPTCVYRIYCQEGTGGLTTPYLTYGTLPLAGASYTPPLPGDATFQSLTGLATPVGKHFAIDCLVTSAGVGPVTSLQSTPVACVAASTALTLVVNTSSVPMTQGASFPSFTPVSVVTGTGGPYNFVVTSALPPGLAQPGLATGTFPSGTATNTGATGTQTFQVTVQVTDTGNSTTGSATFAVPIAPASMSAITPIYQLYADQSISSMSGHHIQAMTGETDIGTLLSGGGFDSRMASVGGQYVSGVGLINTGSSIASPPSTVSDARLRFGIITDPLNPTRRVFYSAANIADGSTFNHVGRMELYPAPSTNLFAKSGVTYWITAEIYLPTTVLGTGGTIFDLHNSNPPSVSTGPFEMGIDTGEIFPNPNIFASRIIQPSPPGSFTETYPFASNNNGFNGGSITDGLTMPNIAWPGIRTGSPASTNNGDWVKIIMKYRGDPSGSTSNGIFQLSIQSPSIASGVLQTVINETACQIGTNDGPQGYPFDYFKVGIDMQGKTPTNGAWFCIRSTAAYLDQGYTAAQIAAVMP